MARRRRQALTPAQVGREVQALRELAGHVLAEYGWCHDFGLSGNSGEGVYVRSGKSDPVGGLVASGQKAAARRAVERATEHLGQATSSLRAALSALEEGIKARVPEPAQGPFPRVITDNALHEARAAQARRAERGEGHGGA